MRHFSYFPALLVAASLLTLGKPTSATAGGVLQVQHSFSVTAVAVDDGITEIAPYDFFEISYTIDQSTADTNSSIGAGTFPALATAFSLAARPLNALPWNPAGNSFDLLGGNYFTNAFGDNFTFQIRGSEFPDGGPGLPFYDLDLNWAWPDDVTDSGLVDQFGIQVGVGGIFKPGRAVMMPSYIRFRAGPDDYRTVLIMPVTPTLAGDYNADGVVDAADYTVWRDKAPGAGFLANDATPGTISDDDYDVWKANFGHALELGAAAASAVPEPNAIAMGFIAIVVSIVTRRYHRR